MSTKQTFVVDDIEYTVKLKGGGGCYKCPFNESGLCHIAPGCFTADAYFKITKVRYVKKP